MLTIIEDQNIRNQVWELLRLQAEEICQREPLLQQFINESILKHNSFGYALVYRLANKLGGQILTINFFLEVFKQCLEIDKNGVVEKLAIEDLIAVEERDPACLSIAQVFLYFKGYKSIQAYRYAHLLWVNNRPDLALAIQSRCTEVFGVDIHPGAIINGGLMIDHGTGVVIGETAVIGKNCSFLHGITLGSTGTSQDRDRHPKLGDNVFLGCNVTVLGNIIIGSHSRVGAGSLVLKPLPPGSTAVGSPAIIKSINSNFANINNNNTTNNNTNEINPDWALPNESNFYQQNQSSLLSHSSSTSSLSSQNIEEIIDNTRPAIRLWSSVWYPKLWYNKTSQENTKAVEEYFRYEFQDYQI